MPGLLLLARATRMMELTTTNATTVSTMTLTIRPPLGYRIRCVICPRAATAKRVDRRSYDVSQPTV